ncbi:LOW QUALITY PROTEIN: fasciculation and elongation protein zeta-2 [Neosynchiropus ocellatus]
MAAPATHLEQEWSSAGGLSADLKGLLSAEAAALLDDGGRSRLPDSSAGDEDFKPLGDLATEFDERLTTCFQNVEFQPDSSVQGAEEELLLAGDEIWTQLTSHYGRVMPVDWMRSRTRSLHITSFNLPEKPRPSDGEADQSDDEELREQLDMHSIIVSSLTDEPLFTAEQVIEELEEMMQDSADVVEEQLPSQTDLSMFSMDAQQLSFSPDFQDRVKALSVAELNERLEETEATIRRFSEELVQQLALRDELDFEKEVKNSFISALIDVQNRQKEHREMMKKKKKLKGGASSSQAEKTHGSVSVPHSGRSSSLQLISSSSAVLQRFSMEGLSSVIQNSFRQTFGTPCSERQYLTTVIPYERKGHPPSLEDLQILTKILHAMRDDSDKVPGLLTDYILKVLCPT